MSITITETAEIPATSCPRMQSMISWLYQEKRFIELKIKSDSQLVSSLQVSTLTPILACQDRSLKVLRDSTVMYSVEVPGPPTALQLFYNDGGENGDEVLYGTSDGKIGQVRLTRQGPHTQWLLERDGANSAIQSIYNYDITQVHINIPIINVYKY